MKVGFIGCGNMGGALARAISQVSQTNIYLFDTNSEKRDALAKEIGAEITSAEYIAKECDFIFMAVKPAIIRSVISELLAPFSENKKATVVSMAAGVKIEVIEGTLPSGTPVIRIMPNTSVAIGRGVTAYAKNSFVTEKTESDFLAIMAKTGLVDSIPEELIDAESALAGSGPAFVYMFLDALASGAVKAGLPSEKAILYAAKTLEGAAATFLASGKTPSELCRAVCSPGGSTIEGVKVLTDNNLTATVESAIMATYNKAKRLGS